MTESDSELARIMQEMSFIESRQEIGRLEAENATLRSQLTTPRQFRAKIYGWDDLDEDSKEDYPVANDDGFVVGWYADGIMVGKALECDEDGVIFEWWTWVEEDSVEAV
jgi:hypothetical protein